ncbi:hypothetical protein SprV_0501995100 [Sparganum proliferum]
MYSGGRTSGLHAQRPPYSLFFPFLLALTISARTAKGDTQSEKSPKTLDPTSGESSNRTKTEVDTYKQPCTFYCYLTTGNQDEVNCTGLPAAPPVSESASIPCYFDAVERQIVIGNKSSVRRITPGGLRVLASPHAAYLRSSKNRLNLYLRLNILEMNATALEGLEDVLRQIQIYNLHYLHPDTFTHHARLSAISFDTATPPEFPRTLAAKLPENDSSLPIRPFFRLSPEDASTPFAFNLDVRCHRCGNDSESGSGEDTEEEDLIIITFPREKRPSTPTPPLNVLDSLSLIYLDSCPRFEGGLGCPLRLSADSLNTTPPGVALLPYVVSELAPTGWSDDEVQTNGAEMGEAENLAAAAAAHSSALTTFLVVWCSLITIVLLCVCVVLFIRRRRLFTPKSLKSYTLRTPAAVSTKRIINYSGSCEELTNRQAATARGPGFSSNSAYQTPSLRSSNVLLNHQSAALRRPSRSSYAAGDGDVVASLHRNSHSAGPDVAAILSPPLRGPSSLRGSRSLGQRFSAAADYDDDEGVLTGTRDTAKGYWGISQGPLQANGDTRVLHFAAGAEPTVPDSLPPHASSVLRSAAPANVVPTYKRSEDGLSCLLTRVHIRYLGDSFPAPHPVAATATTAADSKRRPRIVLCAGSLRRHLRTSSLQCVAPPTPHTHTKLTHTPASA